MSTPTPTRAENAIVMHCQINGATQLATTAPAEQVASILNAFISRAAMIIKAHNGVLIRQNGNSIGAAWGIEGSGGALEAIALGLALREDLPRFNKVHVPAPLPPLQLAIGFDVGPALVAQMGPKLELTLVGDVAAAAQNISKMAEEREADFLITKKLHELAKDDFIYRACTIAPIETLKVRGIYDENRNEVIIEPAHLPEDLTPPHGTTLPAGEENFVDPALLEQTGVPAHWFIRQGDEMFGPFSKEEIVAGLKSTELMPSMLACQDLSNPTWTQLSMFEEFRDFCKSAA